VHFFGDLGETAASLSSTMPRVSACLYPGTRLSAEGIVLLVGLHLITAFRQRSVEQQQCDAASVGADAEGRE
jgi:hypothetical protein